MQTAIKVTNPTNGLDKIIDTGGYILEDYRKTFEVYIDAGYRVEVVRLETMSW